MPIDIFGETTPWEPSRYFLLGMAMTLPEWETEGQKFIQDLPKKARIVVQCRSLTKPT